MCDEFPTNKDKVDILLKEYATLRTEVSERLKIAFSHIAYFGAITAFAFPVASKSNQEHETAIIIFAIVGAISLLTVAWINLRWIQHLGFYLAEVEDKINGLLNDPKNPLIGWDTRSKYIQNDLHWIVKKIFPKPSYLSNNKK